MHPKSSSWSCCAPSLISTGVYNFTHVFLTLILLVYYCGATHSISEDELEHDDEAGAAYRLKYERAVRELEYTRKRLQTQHEHDLEQLVGLKKQLEKKLADAFEEIDEQRKVVAQWKRKNQKMAGEMNDLRILLDEQNARNNVLEKKQKKFDSELQGMQDIVKLEKQAKEKLSKENHALNTEKYQQEQTIAVRLNLILSKLTNYKFNFILHFRIFEMIWKLTWRKCRR